MDGRDHPFTFDRVFGPQSTQGEVFGEVAELVQSALDGFHVCIFSYGQTGAGKTHTMQVGAVGSGGVFEDCNLHLLPASSSYLPPMPCVQLHTRHDPDAAPLIVRRPQTHHVSATPNPHTHTHQGSPTPEGAGIIPRAVELILSRVGALAAQDWQYSLEASFIEVYNNQLRCVLGRRGRPSPVCLILLHPPSPPLSQPPNQPTKQPQGPPGGGRRPQPRGRPHP